ncbi:MAG: hydrogenase maturation nickel metallochaperone HypA [Terriglobia bacterium]
MHELSIALSIIEMAEEEAERRGNARVDAIHLKLGPLSGIVPEALLSAYELACERTRLAGSKLMIETIPVLVYCPACQAQRVLKSIQSFCCPECGTLTPDVRQGRELEVVALELRE